MLVISEPPGQAVVRVPHAAQRVCRLFCAPAPGSQSCSRQQPPTCHQRSLSMPTGKEGKMPGAVVTALAWGQAGLDITFRRPCLSILSLFLGISSNPASPAGS